MSEVPGMSCRSLLRERLGMVQRHVINHQQRSTNQPPTKMVGLHHQQSQRRPGREVGLAVELVKCDRPQPVPEMVAGGRLVGRLLSLGRRVDLEAESVVCHGTHCLLQAE